MRWVLLLLMMLGCDEGETITVGAASSLAGVMPAVAAAYETDHGARVRLVFASSGKIVQQQRGGAGFDVLLLADGRQSGTAVAGNTLVLIGAESLDELPGLDRIAIGAPDTVPAGRYARQALQAAGVWDALDGKLVYGASVRQVLAYAERGEVDAAIVYATDAAGVPIDPALHEPIVYVAAAFTDAGDGLVKFLAGDVAQDRFAKHGFASGTASPRDVGLRGARETSVAWRRGSDEVGSP